MLETTDADADVIWRSGFLGTLHVMQAAHPHLVKTQGNIINVISGAMLGGFGKNGVYGSVKAAIRTLTRSAAVEWGPLGIRVNCISPSAQTPALEQWKKDFPKEYAQRTAIIPLQRFGDPEHDIGRALVALGERERALHHQRHRHRRRRRLLLVRYLCEYVPVEAQCTTTSTSPSAATWPTSTRSSTRLREDGPVAQVRYFGEPALLFTTYEAVDAAYRDDDCSPRRRPSPR